MSLSYDTAKKLKDAGFPQEGDGYELHTPDCKGWDGPSACTGETRAYSPTLSELIEACGDKFGELCRNADGSFSASGKFGVEMDGPTPEEAVAALWLALNGKKS